MPSFVTVVIQSALLKAAANITAQTLAGWKQQANAPFDWGRVLEFAVFGVVSAPLVSLWQQVLEEKLPTQQRVEKQSHTNPEKQPANPSRLNWHNVFLKVLLDQTFGLFFTNVIFITCTTGARLQSTTLILREIEARIMGILKAGWRIWTPVALVNFIWVPWQWRVVVASVVGFGWNIVLSLLATSK